MMEQLYRQNFLNISGDLEDGLLAEKYRDLVSSIQDNEIAAVTAIFREENIVKLEELSLKIKKYQKVLVLGVGGSSLGGRAITSLRDQNKLQFLESIDPKTVENSLKNVDFDETFFLVISKSGETIETICQSLIILDKIGDLRPENFLFVTQSDDNSLAKIAKKIGAPIFHHPKDVGGRFSCFSVTGLLPALICNIDVRKLLRGGKKILQEFLSSKENEVVKACSVQLELCKQGLASNVMMPYIDVLKNFTDWYRQLWAESLGKNGFGLTPINSMGTVDQHSQLQLYLEGPRDKFYNFFTLANHGVDFAIKDLKNCETLFGGKNLSKIVEIEQNTTIETLNLKGLPIRIFEIDNLDEEVLGALMMQMFLETILLANYKNIDPFDQPAVELRKDLAREMLRVG